MAMIKRKVKHVVADSGAFIRNAPLRDIGEEIYSHHNVVEEIKDKATKQRLQFLPYKLTLRDATPEAVRIVTDFSKKTGDYPSLSATDIKVLALTYQLEKEFVGTKHIKTVPDTKIEINLTTPTPSQPTQIAGFYLGTSQETSNSRTTSESTCDGVSDSIDAVTSALEHQTLSELPESDQLDESESPEVQQIYVEHCDDSGGPIHNLVDDDDFPVLSRDLLAATADDFPEFAGDSPCEDCEDFPVLSRGLLTSEEDRNDLLKDLSSELHCESVEDFPALSRDLSDGISEGASVGLNDNLPPLSHRLDCDQVSSTSQQSIENVETENTADDSGDQFADAEEFPSLSVAGHVPEVSSQGQSEEQLDSDDYPVLPNHGDFPSLLGQSQALIEQRENEENVRRSADNKGLQKAVGPTWTKGFSYAKITREGQAKVQTAPAAPKVYREGQVLPSNVIGEERDESEEEEEEEEGAGFNDDGEGWITPSNIKAVKKQMGFADMEQADVVVGCLTTDFAMQNVLIQMGLNVISVDGMLIKKAKSYVLRCFACFRVTSKMEKLFCPHCGNHTLKRIAMTVNEDGTIKYFFSRRKKLSAKGLRYSLPKPKGGKHVNNPLLVADQPMPQQRPSKKALQAMDVFDPDFVLSESPFSKHDVSSRAAQLGIMRRGPGCGQRHKIGVKKSQKRRK